MSEASSRASAGSTSGSRGRGSRSTGRSRSTRSAGPSSPETFPKPDGSRTCGRSGPGSSRRSISSAGGSPVRTSPSPGGEQESTAPARVFGPNLPDSFASYDPATSSWRTSPRCSPARANAGTAHRSEEFSATWPRSGMTRSGRSYPLESSGHPTYESGSGSSLTKEKVPTPRATDGERGGRGDLLAYVRTGKGSRRRQWPTPHGMPKRGQRRRPGPSGNELGRAVLQAERERSQPLPTPNAVEARTGAGYQKGKGSKRYLTLTGAAREIEGRPHDRAASGQLNPTWVEWLMGFPTGWTALRRSETPSSLRSLSGSGDGSSPTRRGR